LWYVRDSPSRVCWSSTSGWMFFFCSEVETCFSCCPLFPSRGTFKVLAKIPSEDTSVIPFFFPFGFLRRRLRDYFCPPFYVRFFFLSLFLIGFSSSIMKSPLTLPRRLYAALIRGGTMERGSPIQRLLIFFEKTPPDPHPWRRQLVNSSIHLLHPSSYPS